ncbi:MAG: response regulator [bacterium]|nr:response regulator [bacterium]
MTAAAREADILLVEDNPGDVRLVAEAARESGIRHRLRVARSGDEATALLRPGACVRPPDLVILDLSLPGKNGFEVLAEMKRNEALRRIPVVVLTGSDREEDLARAYDLGANMCVTKPFDLREFLGVAGGILSFWLTVAALPGPGGRGAP